MKTFIFLLTVAQAPLKPKTPRGTKTPINRNQLTQNRGLGGIMVKRAYETVSWLMEEAGLGGLLLFRLESGSFLIVLSCLFADGRGRGPFLCQWKASDLRDPLRLTASS